MQILNQKSDYNSFYYDKDVPLANTNILLDQMVKFMHAYDMEDEYFKIM